MICVSSITVFVISHLSDHGVSDLYGSFLNIPLTNSAKENGLQHPSIAAHAGKRLNITLQWMPTTVVSNILLLHCPIFLQVYYKMQHKPWRVPIQIRKIQLCFTTLQGMSGILQAFQYKEHLCSMYAFYSSTVLRLITGSFQQMAILTQKMASECCSVWKSVVHT